MSQVPLDPIYISFHNDDPSMMPSCIVDGQSDTFVLTTGSFPQDIVFSVGTSASANLTSLSFVLHEAKEVIVERCASAIPTNFEPITKLSLARSAEGTKQVEKLSLDPNKEGKNIRYLRMRVMSGYNHFVGIFNVVAEGEESQQRIAVLESRPEVVM
ncbi:hypothetical protein ERJ75_001668900 [Trypanosoma vivax]|uniref:Uncharacterized protein n=1 Tax=Trypanosoma vivax (strain Y486) TaxID=1055687 RepID=G0U8K7_TRYVY|nr:hypothetical protein TRVL_00482 [Trypanosoma vivax]KAH8604978.1 hypothetical protein ERJ75_001668900 [Trypanosoma vivax]CCC53933.1 conserved hypothetical protein [Trypanosoma vivax Y486]